MQYELEKSLKRKNSVKNGLVTSPTKTSDFSHCTFRSWHLKPDTWNLFVPDTWNLTPETFFLVSPITSTVLRKAEKDRSQSAKPNNPTFHYSNTPWHWIAAIPPGGHCPDHNTRISIFKDLHLFSLRSCKLRVKLLYYRLKSDLLRSGFKT
jgi:hypothetical protein